MPAASKRKVRPNIVDYFPNMWFPTLKAPAYTTESIREGSEFQLFWKKIMTILQDGFYIGNLYIHGWLLWHTVMWHIELDYERNGKSFKRDGIPTFRDVEFICMEDLIRAEFERRGWFLMGARGTAKSNIAASMAAYYYTCWHDTEVILSAAGAPDLGPLAAKAEYGLTRLDSRTLRKQRIKDNWKVEVRAGYKDEEGNRYGSNSRFQIRNFDEGNAPMACNGLRGKLHIFEEIGKHLNLQECYDDSAMCWMNDYGQFGIPFGIGTGGSADQGAEAKAMFFNPGPNNLLEFPDIFEGRKKPISRFLPVTMARNEYKEPWSLWKYLTEKRGMSDLKHHPLLDSVTIHVSNEEKCYEEFVKPRRALAAQSTDPSKLIKEVAYYCLTPTEAFTILNVNKFPTEGLKKHRAWLDDEGITGINVVLSRNPDTSVNWKESNTVFPVMDYPLKSDSVREGCVVIYEFPEKDAPPMTYISGADPYNQHQAPTSDSLGSFYVYKRITTVTGTFQRELVASYVGRPATMNEWHDTVEMLMDMYDAVCLPENEGSTFTQHFDQVSKLHMLADVFDFRKEISPGSKTDRSKGLPATPAYISFCMNLTYDYVNEKIIIGYIKDKVTGNDVPVERMGYTRIRDPLLLEEMINYDGIKNADRLVAFRHVLALEKSIEKYGTQEAAPKSSDEYEVKPRHIKTPFFTRPPSKIKGKRNSAFILK